MSKTFATFVLCAFLSACATFTNPATRERLATVEASYGVVLSAAVAYRDVCNRRIIARATCTPIVQRMRSYDTRVQAALASARVAVKAGDDLTAGSALVTAQRALTAFQEYQTQHGVR